MPRPPTRTTRPRGHAILRAASCHDAGPAAAEPHLLDLADHAWAAFVDTHPDATAFHLPAWARLVAECYGFRAFALTVRDASGAVNAGVPVVEVRKPWGARAWVSLPFTDHCPALVDAAAAPSLLPDAARRALAGSGARRLRVRAELPTADNVPVAVRHVLALGADPDEVYARFHRSQVQRNIRRAEREGVTVRVATEERDLTEVFYDLHRRTRQRQGVPVQPRRFCALVWQHAIAAGHGRVLVAEHRGVPVAAAVFLRHNGTVIYKWGASDAGAWPLRPNHALFWHAIRVAVADGDTTFDWGRTDLDNAGLRAFKSAWGACELPLVYSTLDVSGATTRAGGHRDLGASAPARLAATVIRRSPAWVCSALGEALYRYTA